jgi:hypothetical protein
MSDEFTPTLEEFVYSFVPTRWFDPTLENLYYWTVKAAIAASPPLVHTVFLMSRGVPYMEAGYVATNTLGAYRFMSKARTAAAFVTSPMLVVGAAAVAAQVHTLSSPPPPEYRGSGEPGWWRSVAQALTGGFGVGTGVKL